MEQSVWLVSAYPILVLRVFDSYDKAEKYFQDIINHNLEYQNYYTEYNELWEQHFISSDDKSKKYPITIIEYKVE